MTIQSVTIGIRDGRVVIFNHEARLVLAFSWRAAIDVAHAMMWKARGIEAPDSQAVAEVRVRRDGESIVLEQAMTGRCFAVWALEYAHAIGEIMIAKARELETKENAEQVAWDQALLFRKGMKFGVTSDPRLQHEAGQLAAWDSRLRHYLPGGIRGREQFGAPTLVRGKTTAFSVQELGIVRRMMRKEAHA